VYPAVLLIYFISAALILLASLALIVQVSLPYKKTGNTSIMYKELIIIIIINGNIYNKYQIVMSVVLSIVRTELSKLVVLFAV
jgi:hypothetical protein